MIERLFTVIVVFVGMMIFQATAHGQTPQLPTSPSDAPTHGIDVIHAK